MNEHYARRRNLWALSLAAIAVLGLMSLAQALPPPESESEPHPDTNPGLRKLRKEFFRERRGLEGHSPDAYLEAIGAARKLPGSPLSGTAGKSPLGAAASSQFKPWTFPVPPPLDNGNRVYGGDASQRIEAIAVHPSDANTVYLGASFGGIAKSVDGGTHWNYVSDSLLSQNIASIVIDPKSPNILYAGTGTSTFFGVGIYRSFDSGATWTLLGKSQWTGSTVGKIAIVEATAGSQTSTTLYASVTKKTEFSLWKSKDSAASWEKIKTGSGAYWWGGGIYDIAIDPASSSTLYITAPDGVFRSKDAGGTWSKIHDIPFGGPRSQLAFVGSTLYLAFRASGEILTVLKSSDRGSNWTELNPPGGSESYCLGVDPAKPNRIFIGGGGNLKYSMDSGNTWNETDGDEVHVDMHAIAFYPGNTDTIYLGNDGGVYRSDDGGKTWANKNHNLSGALIYGISLSGDGHMIQGNQDNGTQLYTGNRKPWKMVYGGDGYRPKIDPNDSSKMYYTAYMSEVSYGGPFRRDKDGTKSVTPPGAFGEKSEFFPAMFAAPNDFAHVIMGFQNVWRSLDSGESWTRIGGNVDSLGLDNNGVSKGVSGLDSGEKIKTLHEAPSDPNVIYAKAKYLWVTANAGSGLGAVWTKISDGLPNNSVKEIAVHPKKPGTAFVVLTDSGHSRVYKTTDRGATWTSISAGLPDAPFTDIVIDGAAPDTLIAASAAGIFSSADSGATWSDMSAGIPAGMEITSLSLHSGSRQLVAGTFGRGAYSTVLPPADSTPPSAVASVNDGDGADTDSTDSQTQLSANWAASSDAESGISTYWYAIGTSEGAADVVSWTDNGAEKKVTKTGLSLAAGTKYYFAVKAENGAGLKSAAAASDGVTVSRADSTKPEVSITYPKNGEKIWGKVRVRALATDDRGVASVEFYLNGARKRKDTKAPYVFVLNTKLLSKRAYTIMAKATDKAGNRAEASIRVKVSNARGKSASVSTAADELEDWADELDWADDGMVELVPESTTEDDAEDPPRSGLLLDGAGGAFEGEAAILRVPPDALDAPTELSIVPEDADPAWAARRNWAARERGLVPASEGVSLRPQGMRLSAPATVELGLAERLARVASKPGENYIVFIWNPSAQSWDALPTAPSEEGRVQARTSYLSTVKVFSVPPAASAPGDAGEIFVFPNPAKRGASPTFHIEAGSAQGLALKVYDLAGHLVHEAAVGGAPALVDRGDGAREAYEVVWDASGAASGVYLYAVSSEGRTLKAGKLALIK